MSNNNFWNNLTSPNFSVLDTHVVFGYFVPLGELRIPLLSLAAAMCPTRRALGPLSPWVGPITKSRIRVVYFRISFLLWSYWRQSAEDLLGDRPEPVPDVNITSYLLLLLLSLLLRFFPWLAAPAVLTESNPALLPNPISLWSPSSPSQR